MTEFLKGVRIDPLWLEPDRYYAHISVRPRFQDLDPLNHVNNVAMAAMFEEARVRFNHPMRDHFQTKTVRTMVAGQTLNYVNECHLRPDLDFYLGIGHMGTSSWGVQACAWQGDTPVLLAIATLVTTRQGQTCPIPAGLRKLLEDRRMKALA
jgi:acyl-CoA thioester hydrolase